MIYRAEVLLPIHAQLGEGVFWDAARQQLYWVDILQGIVYVCDPMRRINRAYPVRQKVSTVAPRAAGGLMIALASAIAHLDLETGDVTEWANPEGSIPGNRFNDGKCDPMGRFWVGTMREDFSAPTGHLYCLHPDGRVEEKLAGVTCSNGLVWSRDARTLYYADTATCQLWAFDFDKTTGNISRQRVVLEVPQDAPGRLDGLAIDAEDCIWAALYGAGCVQRFDPHTGRQLDCVEVPGARSVSACAFGGPTLDRLFITTAAQDADLDQQPNAGNLFVADVGIRGAPMYAFAG